MDIWTLKASWHLGMAFETELIDPGHAMLSCDLDVAGD